MSFRSWREKQLLSQERIAGMSGLSLRTVQRLEAGHRVSYASLRALATAFQVDVDQLERELYAVNKSTEEFVEIPRWARLFADASRGHWMGAKPLSRRQAHASEILCMAGGLVLLVASFLPLPGPVAATLRLGAAFMLACGYLSSIGIRIFDRYKLWPEGEISWSEWRPVRTLRGTIGFYAFVVLLPILFLSLLFWLNR